MLVFIKLAHLNGELRDIFIEMILMLPLSILFSGAFGSSNSSRSEIIQLNFSVSDVQIPDRDAEHVLIEYLISDKSYKRK